MADNSEYTHKATQFYCPRCGRKLPHPDYRNHKKNPCPATPIPSPRTDG